MKESGQNITQNDVTEAILNPENFVEWNSFIKKLELIQNFAGDGYLYHTIYNGISKDVTDRDFVEKKVILEIKDKDEKIKILAFSSSIPDQHFPEQNGIIRCDCVFSMCIIADEEDHINITTYQQ